MRAILARGRRPRNVCHVDPARARRVGLALAATFLVPLVAFLLLPSGMARVRPMVAVEALTIGAGVVGAVMRARREPGARTGWLLFATALLLFWFDYPILVANVFFEPATPLSLVRWSAWLGRLTIPLLGLTMLAWPLGPRTAAERVRAAMDGLIFGASAFFLAWVLGLGGVVRHSTIERSYATSILFGNAFRMLNLGIVVYLAGRDRRMLRGPLGWLGASQLIATVSGLLVVTLRMEGLYFAGHWSALAMSAGLVMEGVMPWLAAPPPPRSDAPAAPSLGGALPYVPAGAALVVTLLTVAGPLQPLDAAGTAFALVIIATLLLRQFLALRDVRHLSESLEAQVADRTRALAQSQAALVRTQRLEAVGRLAGGVAHDFNNLLTVIRGYASLLRQTLPHPDPRGDDVVEIDRAAQRGAALTQQLLAFASRQPGEPRLVDPAELLEGVEGLLRRLVGEHVAVEIHAPRGTGPVRIDPAQLEQVLANLAANARDAMPGGGTLRIEVGSVTLDSAVRARLPDAQPGDYVELRVRDTGIGMAPDVISRIFEPFFTTKRAGHGTGLGLATSYGVVRQAGGHIDVESTPGGGSTFHVYLPRADGVAEPLVAPRVAPAPTRGAETILLAEDTAAVRDILARVLRSNGYTVLTATDGEDAVAVAARHDGPIDLLVSDVAMPRLAGPLAAARIRAARPELRVLLMSGYAESPDLETIEPGELLLKPFEPDAFARRVRDVLDGR